MGKVLISGFRHWNQYVKYYQEIGSGVPVWCEPPKRFITGGMIVNDLELGEYLAGGTPVEFNVETKKAKLLKLWRIVTATVSGTDTVVTFQKAWDLPLLKNGMVIMVVPSTPTGTGKAFLLTGLTETDTTYTFTVATDALDTLTVGGFLAESAATATGTGASLYAIPNSLTLEETVGGDQNSVGVARGHKYIYRNTIPPMPNSIANLIPDLYFDFFNELQSSGYVE